MEFDNNEHEETCNLIIITNRIKIIRNAMFMLCTSGLCRKYSYGQLNENRIVRPCVRVCVCVCLHVCKVYQNYVSIVGRSKENKKLTLLTYMCMRGGVYK